ncbi:MAG TPA: hypothetical protein PK765_05050 [bacterium]|nr:hypothetical protein [bacterium]
MKRIGADPTGCDHINYASHSDSGKSLGLADFGLAEDTRKRVAILSIDLNNQSAQVRMLAAKQILQIIEPGNPRNTRTRELYT